MTDDIQARLYTENRQLKQAVHDLADAVEDLVDELDEQTQGRGPPEHAQAARERAQDVRERTPPPVTDAEQIQPTWEEDGYADKQAWLDDKRGD